MSMPRNFNAPFVRASLYAALSLALPFAASAQQAPASSSSSQSGGMDMGGMDMGSMPGMDMPASSSSAPSPATTVHKTAGPAGMPVPSALPPNGVQGSKKADKPAKPGAMPKMAPQAMPPPQGAKKAKPEPQMEGMEGMDHGSMQGKQGTENGSMQGADHGSMQGIQGMDHSSMPGMHGGMQGMGSMGGMPMRPMQGGTPPPNARSPDYSDGIGYGPAHGLDMAMDDNAKIGMLLLDQLEAFHGKDGNGQTWEAEGWYGNPSDKLWLRTEGERSGGKLEDGDVEAFWNRIVSTYWSTQLGARHDLGGPSRDWAAFGVQGLAPYWFEIEATGYVGPSGRTAARFRAEYELLFTQRLILQPEFETNLYGKSDPARRIGSGLSDASFGVRLRYEIRRQFAPYVGVVWTRRFGGTADFARDDHQSIFDRQWIAGVRIWF